LAGDIILTKFFILIGDITLSLINYFKNLSLSDINDKTDENIDSKIFKRLNITENTTTNKKNYNLVDKIRGFLLPYMLNKISFIIIILISVILIYFTSLEIVGIFLVTTLMTYIFLIYYPQIKKENDYLDMNQELPYALRHMGIELKSGKGLHDSLKTIKDADYGSLSKEFKRVLEEVKFGKSTEDALLEMTKRVKCEGLTRAVHQIIGTLRVGGNLANSLEIIAKDISFDMQIKLKEYSQKLNSFILIYTFIAILAPVISLIMLMAGSTVMGDVISGNLMLITYGLFFPSVVMFMGIFIKKLEPRI